MPDRDSALQEWQRVNARIVERRTELARRLANAAITDDETTAALRVLGELRRQADALLAKMVTEDDPDPL